MPKRLASPRRVCEPLGLRVPALILRAMTRGRTLRSARLLWAGTPGTATKTNSSGKKLSTREASGLLGNVLLDKGLTQCPQLVLEGVLLRHASLLKFPWSQLWVRTLRGPSDSSIINRFDVRGPGE